MLTEAGEDRPLGMKRYFQRGNCFAVEVTSSLSIVLKIKIKQDISHHLDLEDSRLFVLPIRTKYLQNYLDSQLLFFKPIRQPI